MAAGRTPPGRIVNLPSDPTADPTKYPGIIILEFYQMSCPPCHTSMAHLQSEINKNPQLKGHIFKVDVKNNTTGWDLWHRYEGASPYTPAIAVFKDGVYLNTDADAAIQMILQGSAPAPVSSPSSPTQLAPATGASCAQWHPVKLNGQSAYRNSQSGQFISDAQYIQLCQSGTMIPTAPAPVQSAPAAPAPILRQRPR